METLTIIIYIGIFVFAWTGALKARVHHMDVFGGAVMAFVMALGGGTLRDLLIGVHPVNWVTDNITLYLISAATICAFTFKRIKILRFKYWIVVFDALGLGLYTYVGMQKSLGLGINSVSSIVMGVLTACFGGFIADIITNTVPSLLKRGELYATASALGGTVFMLLHNYSHVNNNWNMLLCISIVFCTRMISRWKRVFLPEI